MDIKLNFVPAPKISNSDVKYKGFHPREKSNYVKFTNNKSKELYDELDRIFSDLIDKQQNYIYEIEYQANHSMTCPLETKIYTKEYILSPILEGTELVFNSMMKQMRAELEKTSKEGNKTLNDKKAEVESIFGKYSNYAINFYYFLKYLYKKLLSTCSNILDMFWNLSASIDNYVNRTMQNEFGIHSKYLISYTTDMETEIVPKALKEKVAPKYKAFFETNLGSLISACFEKYEKTYKKSFPDNTSKKFVKETFKNQEIDMEKTISKTLTNSVSKYIEEEVKKSTFKKQESKITKLMPQIGKALDIISQKLNFLPKMEPSTKEKNIAILKMEELKKALSDLSKILTSKSGKLKDNQVKLFDEVFKGVRNTKDSNYKLSETEIGYLKRVYNNGDGPTARIIINLFIMITDEPNRVEGIVKFIKNYIDKLMPNAYPTYNCTDLYRQIKEGKKLIKIESINYPNHLKLLNTLNILKRILEGEEPLFSTTFESNITSVFKIDYTFKVYYNQIKIKSNEFAFRVGKNLIISQNNSIQKLILGFLEKTTADKNFIVNKIKEQIAQSKPVKSEPTESKSTKPESTESGSDKPESTESGSDKPESTESGSGKGKRRRKKKKRK